MHRFARGSEGWLAAPLAGLALSALLAAGAHPAWWAGGALSGLVLAFFLAFFRDPERPVAEGVVSPADGRVVRVDAVEDGDLGPADRLCVFMSPRDVHVNRFPLKGTVRQVRHLAGGHLPAFDKDADGNERVETLLDTPLGTVKVVQIAGAVARRIVPYARPGDAAAKGDRMGLIRLGSRCDLLAPRGRLRFTVQVGDRVLASATQVAEVAT